jgi:DNA (cytosine-5)-methyltransferase 1
MKHIDLFSGIGGFALAVDTVWPESEHMFCDFDPFCQQILKKHWPNSKIYGDIRTITNAGSKKQRGISDSSREEISAPWSSCDILTGGFPCQPFSAAGKRKGTEDNRYLWPEMFRIISTFKPTWVIAENVRGLVTWNEGMVLEQVCTDLEGQGYEVQPFIIPAVAVNAPHRRDRIWFVAHRAGNRRFWAGSPFETEERRATGSKQAGELARGLKRSHSSASDTKGVGSRGRGSKECGDKKWKIQSGEQKGGEVWSKNKGRTGNAADSEIKRGQRREPREPTQLKEKLFRRDNSRNWDDSWLEVATELCGVDDGLPVGVDGFKLTKAGHRTQRLKALGNSIVPQVAIEIMKSIKCA